MEDKKIDILGSDPYDVNLVVIDAISRGTGSEWEHAWWV